MEARLSEEELGVKEEEAAFEPPVTGVEGTSVLVDETDATEGFLLWFIAREFARSCMIWSIEGESRPP